MRTIRTRSVLVLGLLGPLLCGCLAEQNRQFASCRRDANKLYPDDTVFSSTHAYVVNTCMAAHGYERVCVLYYNSNCYAPMGRLKRIMWRLEIGWDNWSE